MASSGSTAALVKGMKVKPILSRPFSRRQHSNNIGIWAERYAAYQEASVASFKNRSMEFLRNSQSGDAVIQLVARIPENIMFDSFCPAISSL